MRITSKGQVTIPIAIRERFGLLPDTEVEFRVEKGRVILARAKSAKGQSRGERIVARMLGKGTANRDMSTDEILALTRGYDLAGTEPAKLRRP